MARKFEQHYVRSITDPSRELVVDDLKTALECADDFRAVWGGEYVEFHHEEGVIYPTGGSFGLLGCTEAGMKVDVKEYTPEEFCELLRDTNATEFVLIFVSEGGVPQKDSSLASIFNYVQVTNYLDYPKMVTDLKERGWLTTCESQNILRTDERRFTLRKEAVTVVKELEDYTGETYEVDSLGTTFWDDLTKGIERLWSSRLKVVSEHQQSVTSEEHGET